jgi:hypothetical protein
MLDPGTFLAALMRRRRWATARVCPALATAAAPAGGRRRPA